MTNSTLFMHSHHLLGILFTAWAKESTEGRIPIRVLLMNRDLACIGQAGGAENDLAGRGGK
jgi:hypothetical protein